MTTFGAMPFSAWPAHYKIAAVVIFVSASLAVYFAASWFMHALPTGLVWPFVGLMLALYLACGIVGYASAHSERRQRRDSDSL